MSAKLSFCQRQCEYKFTAFIFTRTLRPNLSTLRFDKMFGNGQADARAAVMDRVLAFFEAP